MTKPSPSLDAHIGTRMRLRRIEAGLARDELAAKVGLTEEALRRHEEGREPIGAGCLYEIAFALDVPIIYFFQDAEEWQDAERTDHGQPVLAGVIDANFRRLVAAYSSISSPSKRSSLVRLIECYARVE